MIIKLFSVKYFTMKHLLLLSIFTFQIFSAQTAPTNSRLFQINSLKGSLVNVVESTENHIYHIGSANSEIGIDGYTKNIDGKDELFVLKSNISDGSNVWLKTFNSASAGTLVANYTYIDADDNIYVYGSFTGSFTLGVTTIESSAPTRPFVMKINSAGEGLWITALENTYFNQSYKTKMAADSEDLFMITAKNHLIRINNNTGEIIYNKSENYPGDFRSLILKNDNIYLAGYNSNYETAIFGTESIGSRNGYILRGDKSANFTASVKINGVSGKTADISDIAFDSDGKLILSGFTVNEANLTTETGTYTYTFNPNLSYFGDKTYYYTAKIAADFGVVDYYRTSSPITNSGSADISTRSYFTRIIPYGNAGYYKLILTGVSLNSNFTNPDGTSSSTPAVAATSYSLLISCNNIGTSAGGIRSVFPNRIITANSIYFSNTELNTRLFTTQVNLMSNGQLKWTKQKTTSVGGSFLIPFISHLNSEKGESFVTAIVEGKGNFFGQKVLNSQSTKSRYVTRLGIDGLPKWFARFHVDSGFGELNIAGDFATVDKDDNFLFLSNTSANSSTFTDANGQSVDFQQENNLTSKVLIKLDKNGNLLWSKQLNNSQYASSRASLSSDNNGNILLIGKVSNGTMSIDGNTLGAVNTSSTFVIKLNGLSGNVIFAKHYADFLSNSMHPVFDAENNFYLFAKSDYRNEDFNFDGLIIPRAYSNNSLMLKFNSSGSVIWGKNFYANNNVPASSYAEEVKFDGTDFIMMGVYDGTFEGNFKGLDLENIPVAYSSTYSSLFIAKINIAGNVLWQKPIYNNIGTLDFPTMDLDNQKNIYLYRFAYDKNKFDGVEYSFDPTFGERVVFKFDTNAAFKYIINIEKSLSVYKYIDVLKEDTFNILSYTQENNLFNYPVKNNNATNMYIATFGQLDKKYLTPEKNYLELNTLEISNRPVSTDNQFSFDLINNVNWSAISDQAWLNLSFTNLSGKNPLNTINGNGDAKITLTADQNITGVARTSSIMITGEEVVGKTIIVTQGAILATGESKLSIITLYPNPTSDYLNIKTDHNISKVDLFDMTGKLVLSSKLQEHKVDVSTLIKGNYVIKIYTESGVVTSKFIKN